MGLEAESDVFASLTERLFTGAATESAPQAVGACRTWSREGIRRIAAQPDDTRALIACFDRIGDEDDRTIRHQDMRATLVTTTRAEVTSRVATPVTKTCFAIRRTGRVD